MGFFLAPRPKEAAGPARTGEKLKRSGVCIFLSSAQAHYVKGERDYLRLPTLLLNRSFRKQKEGDGKPQTVSVISIFLSFSVGGGFGKRRGNNFSSSRKAKRSLTASVLSSTAISKNKRKIAIEILERRKIPVHQHPAAIVWCQYIR